jgi:hypothetical protein
MGAYPIEPALQKGRCAPLRIAAIDEPLCVGFGRGRAAAAVEALRGDQQLAHGVL